MNEDENMDIDPFSFTFIESQKGKFALLRKGFRYNYGSLNKKGTSLCRCVKRKECSASVTLNKAQTDILKETEHSCNSNTIKNKMDYVMDKCKNIVRSKFTPVKKVIEKQFRKCTNLKVVPSYDSKKDTLYRARRKFKKMQIWSKRLQCTLEMVRFKYQYYLINCTLYTYS